jgi:hypothetical protein
MFIFTDLEDLDQHISNLQGLKEHREKHPEITKPIIYAIFPTAEHIMEKEEDRRDLVEKIHDLFWVIDRIGDLRREIEKAEKELEGGKDESRTQNDEGGENCSRSQG